MNLLAVIESMNQVCWSPPANLQHARVESRLLTERQIKHGWIGVSRSTDGQRSLTDRQRFCHVRQVHGVTIVEATHSDATTNAIGSSTTDLPEADGVWTRNPHSPIAVKTADCLPVFMATNDGRWVAALHAGWRGLTNGILLKAITEFSKCISLQDLICVIGPAIGREAFEVRHEIVVALQSPHCGLSPDLWSLALSKGRGDRWHVDLSSAAVLQLLSAGIGPQQIEVLQRCTYRDSIGDGPDARFNWHSYRREGAGCGSNWSWIQCRPSKNPR